MPLKTNHPNPMLCVNVANFHLMPKKRKHRIIVLEDDRTTRKLITRCLDEAGYESIECHEGKDALHSAEMWPPIAMVVDVMLPDMQGTELVSRLREDPNLQDIRVVFLTGILKAKSNENDYQFKIGDESFPALSKPINFPRLLQLVGGEIETSIRIKDERAKEELKQRAAAEEATKQSEKKEEPQGFYGYEPEIETSAPTNDLEYERGKSSSSSDSYFL